MNILSWFQSKADKRAVIAESARMTEVSRGVPDRAKEFIR
jgi:hypothetical protein